MIIPENPPIARLRTHEGRWANEIEGAEAKQDAQFFKEKDATPP
jgi:hypothetical protein